MKNLGAVRLSSVSIIALMSALPVWADGTAQDKLALSTAHYAKRAEAGEAAAALADAVEAEKLATDNDTKFDAIMAQSWASYWIDNHLARDSEKVPAFEQLMANVDRATDVNPDYADSYYMHAIALARWGQAKGKLQSLFRVPELKKALQNAIDRNDREGNPGEAMDNYGPDRVLGRIYFELPGLAGGDNKKSMKYLQTTVDNSPQRALGWIYYAETLNAVGQKNKAISVLKDLLAKDPASMEPKKIPETIEDFDTAKDLLKSIGG